jgi:hypothetical protein
MAKLVADWQMDGGVCAALERFGTGFVPGGYRELIRVPVDTDHLEGELAQKVLHGNGTRLLSTTNGTQKSDVCRTNEQ